MKNDKGVSNQTGLGQSDPLGAAVYPEGTNFSVFSKSSSKIELLLFEAENDPLPSRAIPLDPGKNRTYHYWHIFVPGVKAGQIYGYRAHGPFEPQRGLCFDPAKVLLDPYGKGVVVPEGYSRVQASEPGENTASAMKSVVADPHAYDWEGDAPLKRSFSGTVIYEMHVGGFTRNPNSGVVGEKRGTYAGLISKIPYLQELGITAVELLPIFQFDEQNCPPGLVNYWGYCPISFFAPHQGYSSRQTPLGPLSEFRDMVKALHRAGIEVILDVVFNHTAEGDRRGPTLCFRGLENGAYYILGPGLGNYADYTGTGNTVNANHPIVRRLILDSLRYWVKEMHVDGFRFDLASILSRDESGRPIENPPIIWDIESDPALAGTKLIAEAWDAAGLYQVGNFIGDSWKDWNGRFRDDVRSFLKGDRGSVTNLPARLLASPDLYGHREREAEQSVNFVTCHDGFTLNDLVSYNEKHNHVNKEENRDGSEHNLSWNCGAEGPADDPEVERLRSRQVKNFFTITLLALGTPMLLMGDEVRRTQRGNNNGYCQNNEISWFDWSLLRKHQGLHRFVRQFVSFRAQRDMSREHFPLSLNQLLKQARIQWHGIRLNQPDWSVDSHSLAFTAWSLLGRFMLHVMFNAYWEPLRFEIPPLKEAPEQSWRRLVDTFREPPEDIHRWRDAPIVRDTSYLVQPRSIAVLICAIAEPDPEA